MGRSFFDMNRWNNDMELPSRDYVLIFKQVYDKVLPESLEIALTAMKDAGASQIDSIGILVSELRISLPDADALVLNSTTCQKEKESTLKFRAHIDNLFDELENED